MDSAVSWPSGSGTIHVMRWKYPTSQGAELRVGDLEDSSLLLVILLLVIVWCSVIQLSSKSSPWVPPFLAWFGCRLHPPLYCVEGPECRSAERMCVCSDFADVFIVFLMLKMLVLTCYCHMKTKHWSQQRSFSAYLVNVVVQYKSGCFIITACEWHSLLAHNIRLRPTILLC